MRILIELPSWLGDTVMTTPAIENISNFYIDSNITLIGSFIAIETLKNHPLVDKSYVLERNYFNMYKAIKSLGEYDIFLSFRGSIRSKLMKFFVLSERKYQFDKSKFVKSHQVEKYNNFVNDSLQIKTITSKLVLHTKKKNEKNSNKLLGINPGASYGSAKRWYPKEFAKVAIDLSDQYDIIIFGGPGEIDIASDIEKYLIKSGIKNYQNLASKTSITELMSLIASLDIFITGDSGPMHLAAAFQIPTITIFGPTNDQETSQWMNEKSVIVKKDLKCQPCMKRICPLKHHNCMKEIKAKDILTEVKRLN